MSDCRADLRHHSCHVVSCLTVKAQENRHHFLTFSQIISAALEALDDPAIRDEVRRPLRYLLVDEYQDINPSQERLIELLAAPPVQLTVVGDDDQSIYQWRGSDNRHLSHQSGPKSGPTQSAAE